MKNKKSKLLTFILSFVPGLPHIYIGYADRGLIYFILFGGLLFLSIGLGRFSSSGIFDMAIAIGYPILWIVSLVDAFSTINQMREMGNENINEIWNSEKVKDDNQKVITLALSVVPGLGHMYMGQQEKGLRILTVFLMTVFLMGFLGLSILLFILPIIWAYGFFDAFHIVNGNEESSIEIDRFLPRIDLKTGGYILIGIGILSIAQKILYPLVLKYIDPQYTNFIQSFVVALIFIIGGVYLLSTQRNIEKGEDDEK